MNVPLHPLPYHVRIRDFLKENHREVWDWYSSTEAQSDYSEAIQLELLKSTYRLDRSDHEDLYQLADEVTAKLNLHVPVTLYRAQDGGEMSQAALYFTPGKGHIVFGGKILSLLDEEEQRALLGHELAHFKLWSEDDGSFLVTDRILNTMASASNCAPAHFHSARLYRLYTEIYADRGSLVVCNSADSGIATLIKVVTGTTDINPNSYLAQAEEVFSRSGNQLKSGEFSHPENYIRVRSMALWANLAKEAHPTLSQSSIESEIEKVIQGNWSLDDLDLTRQQQLTELTRDLLRHIFSRRWARTGRLLSHAKLYFSDFNPDEPKLFEASTDLAEELSGADDKLRHYLAHILLDFTAADRDLEENGIALACYFADQLDLSDEFEAAARKELKLLKKNITSIRKTLDTRLADADKEHASLTKKETRELED